MYRIFLLLLIVCGALFGEPSERPSGGIALKDELDPKQRKKDFKAWRNLLQYYFSFRQQAKSVLADLQAVSDFAWASQKQLAAVERAAKRVEYICGNISDFRFDNPVQAIKDAELKIFRQTDAFYLHDVPEITKADNERKKARNVLAGRTGDRVKSLKSAALRTEKYFKRKFGRYNEISSLDERSKKPSLADEEKKLFALSATAANRGLSSAETNETAIDNNNAQLSGVLSNAAGDNGKTNPLHQAEFNSINKRNAYILNLQNHQYAKTAIDQLSWLVVKRAKDFERIISQNAVLMIGAEGISKEMKNQAEKHKRK